MGACVNFGRIASKPVTYFMHPSRYVPTALSNSDELSRHGCHISLVFPNCFSSGS